MAAPSTVHYDSQQICDYVLLRHVNVGKDAENEKTYKKWTKLWVVAHCQVSPFDSFISYCKKESQWLKNDSSVSQHTLDEFSLSMVTTKKHDKVIKVEFPSFTIEMSFDSQTKMDLYFKLLSKISMRHHVDLVRAPKHPDREGDYIIEDCSDSYRAWKVLESGRGQLCWEWSLRTIRRIHYHKNVEKLEIEAGRLSETGEGHFYFTGRHAYRLFEAMKTELVARAQQKTQSQNRSLPSSLESSSAKSNLSRSASSASATNMKQKPASKSHSHSSDKQSPLSVGHKPLGPRLSQSNGALPAKSLTSLEESEMSSEDYSASDNSSFTGGTGGSIHDWTTPSPVPPIGNGLIFERPPVLPPRILDTRPFSPCSTTSSSSSSASGYNVPRRAYLPPTPPLAGQPHYMHVKRSEMDEDNDYMTMNSALRRKTPPTKIEPEYDEEEEEEEDESDDEEYIDGEYVDEYTNMQSASRTTSTQNTAARKNGPVDFADQYMRMVPIPGTMVGTLTRDKGDSSNSRASSVPPSLPPQMSSRFRELGIIDSSVSSSRESNNTA